MYERDIGSSQGAGRTSIPLGQGMPPKLETRQNLIQRFIELKRFLFQVNNIFMFCQDDAADVATLIKMLEQCLKRKINLNAKSIDVKLMQNMIEDVWSKMRTKIDMDFC